MAKSKDDINWNQIYQAKFNLSMMEYLDKLRTEILEQVEMGLIADEKLREVGQLTALMNTAGDALSNDILRIIADRLQDALEPQYPYNFLDPYLINSRFAQYKKAFKRAAAKHSQVWDKLYQENVKMMQSQRPEDHRNDLSLPDKFKEWFKKK